MFATAGDGAERDAEQANDKTVRTNAAGTTNSEYSLPDFMFPMMPRIKKATLLSDWTRSLASSTRLASPFLQFRLCHKVLEQNIVEAFAAGKNANLEIHAF